MSEGQIPVSGLDIRHRAITTPHVVDSAVTTPKIADVAVTVGKTDEPVWNKVLESPLKVDVALTTTQTEHHSLTFDIPSWVGTVTLQCVGVMRIRNTSGGAQGFQIVVWINGAETFGGWSDAVNNGVMTVLTAPMQSISTPGATVQVTATLKVISGTNSENASQLRVHAIGVR